MARALIYLGVFVLLGFTAKLNVSDDVLNNMPSILNTSNKLEGEYALKLFESFSFNLESAKSYMIHTTSREKLIQFGKIVNFQNSETHNLICQNLLGKTNEQLVLYDFFIKEILPEGPCRKSLISNQATYLRQFKGKALDIDFEGNITINPDFVFEGEKIKTVESIDYEQNVFYGHEFPNNHVALTFDDGPHHIYTEAIVELLNQYQIKGTFFPVGDRAGKFRDILQKVAEAGHNIGSHSFDHQNLSKIDTNMAFENIMNGYNLIKDILVDTPNVFQNIFRFPYGATTPELQKQVSDAGFSTFFWNIDPRDWEVLNPIEMKESIISAIKKKNKGSIVLLHDFYIQTTFTLSLLLEELQDIPDLKLIVLSDDDRKNIAVDEN